MTNTNGKTYVAYLSFTTEPFASLSPELAQRRADKLAEGLADGNKLMIQVVDVIPVEEVKHSAN